MSRPTRPTICGWEESHRRHIKITPVRYECQYTPTHTIYELLELLKSHTIQTARFGWVHQAERIAVMAGTLGTFHRTLIMMECVNYNDGSALV